MPDEKAEVDRTDEIKIKRLYMVACIAAETGSDCSKMDIETVLHAFYTIPMPRVDFIDWAKATGLDSLLDSESVNKHDADRALANLEAMR